MSVIDYLSVCQLNVQSLLAGVDLTKHIQSQTCKLDEIYTTLVTDLKFDIIALTETWLTNNHSDVDIAIEKYTCFRKDRNNGRGGGLAVYVLNDLHCKRRYDLEHGIIACEMLWLEVYYGTHKILLGTCYRPPGQNGDEITYFLIDVQSCFDSIYSENPECIILTGDFNDRSVLFDEEHPTSELGVRLRDLIFQNNMFQLITEPTHFTDNSAYILDLMITDSPGYVKECGVLPQICELHHAPVYSRFSITRHKLTTITREVWHYKNADTIGLNTALQNVDWSNIIHNSSVEMAVNQVTNKYLQTARDFIPVRKVKIRSKDKPWVTLGLRKLIRLRNRWSGIYNRSKREDHKLMRNIYRSRVKNEFRRLKHEYFENQLHKLNNPSINGKTFWSIAKKLYGNKIKQEIPTLIHNDCHYTRDEDKASLLNTYFAKQSTLPPPLPNYSLPVFDYLTDERLTDIHVTPYQVSQVISKLPVNKASGPDLISNQLLKCTSHTICEPLASLFNKSLEMCTYPSAWKCANLTAVYKKMKTICKKIIDLYLCCHAFQKLWNA